VPRRNSNAAPSVMPPAADANAAARPVVEQLARLGALGRAAHTEPVHQHGRGGGLDVIGEHEGAALEQRQNLIERGPVLAQAVERSVSVAQEGGRDHRRAGGDGAGALGEGGRVC